MVTRVTGPVTGKVAVIKVLHRVENGADGIGWKAWRMQTENFSYFAP